MNCRAREHDIVLFLYDELSETHRNELRAHMDGCGDCRQFYETEKQLHFQLTDDFSEWEVPSDLLVECRRSLSEELDRADSRRSWWRLPALPLLARARWLESAAMLSIGLALGVYVTNQRTVPAPASEQALQATLIPEDASVSNLRIVEADPATGQVQLVGEMVQPMRVRGNLDDDNVRQILFGALQSQSNPGFRLQAVELLARDSEDPTIQEVLVGTLLHDENAAVRLYALEGLKAFSEDDDVRRALMYAVEHDENPGIRVQAIEALTPLTQEEAMEELVQEAVRDDPNAYIRMKALQFVGTGNSGNQ